MASAEKAKPNPLKRSFEALTSSQSEPMDTETSFIPREKETEVLCIIFVERIIAAKVIERLMKKITDLSHFNVSYLTGSNSSVGGLTPKVQTETLESFRLGKVLGDLVESIAGAILIDSRLNLDEVWKVFKPLLSPIVTPDKLELPPSRELMELCDSLGYFIKEHFTADGDIVRAELKLQLEDVLLEAQGSGPNRKAAKGMAALRLLKELELRGITSSKRRKTDTDNVDNASSPRSDDNIRSQPDGEASGSATEKPKPPESQSGIKGDLLKRACSARAHGSKTAYVP
ncbi:UNVERIFIED_CONTAM: Endoribonuclease Dicer3, partial [Sesamum latifolium]